MDVICQRCNEPWEQYYLGHEALYDFPGADAPDWAIDAHSALSYGDVDSHYVNGGERLTSTVISGGGCPACWDDPSRVHNDPDLQLAALAALAASFDAWDGDPADLL